MNRIVVVSSIVIIGPSMSQVDISNQISKASKNSGKTYNFDEEHDRDTPAQMWFQESQEGLVLFIVFYTQACRWSKCLGCNLPSKCSQFPVSYKSIIAQIDHVFSAEVVLKERKTIKKLIISNNGSVLDEDTFSSTALIYLIAKSNMLLPNMSVISMETRPEYVDLAELEFLSRVLKEGDTPTDLEISIGFEAFDDRIRNDIFNKGLRLRVFEDLAKKVSSYDFGLKCYFMQKPVPGITDKEALDDVKNGIDYLSEMVKRYGIRINMHLNPTYVASGTLLEKHFENGEFMPPRMADVAKAVMHSRGKPISVFVGLYDEGLAVEGGSFVREGDDRLVKQLEIFNKTQDYSVLDM